MKPMNTAIIGCGSIVQAHLEATKGLTSLVAVCDIHKERADRVAQEQGCNAYYRVEDLLENQSPDVVHLLTPHHVRADVIEVLLESGIHVLVEKPVGMNLAEGSKVEQLAKNYPGSKTGVVYQNRFNNTTLQLQHLLNEGVIGPVRSIRGHLAWNRQAGYYQASPWRGSVDCSGGGVLINQAIHTLDLIQLLGGDVESLEASTHRFRHKHLDIEDTANIFIQFKNGIKGSLHATVAHENDSPVEIEITGDKGRLMIQNYALWLDLENDPIEKICDESASGVKAYYGGGHGTAVKQFYQAVADNTDNYISVSEALKSLAIVDCVYQAKE